MTEPDNTKSPDHQPSSFSAYQRNEAQQRLDYAISSDAGAMFRTRGDFQRYERKRALEEARSDRLGRPTEWMQREIDAKNIVRLSSNKGASLANRNTTPDVTVSSVPSGPDSQAETSGSATSSGGGGGGAGALPHATFTVCVGGEPQNWELYGYPSAT